MVITVSRSVPCRYQDPGVIPRSSGEEAEGHEGQRAAG